MKESHSTIFERIARLDQETSEFGFEWTHPQQLFDKVKEECKEAEEAFKEGAEDHLQEEIGDLMLATFELCMFHGFSPQETMENSFSKFQKRFEETVKLAKADGYVDLKGQPIELILSYWSKAKKAVDV